MKYAKNQLLKYRQKPLVLAEQLNLESVAKQRFPETVLALSPLEVAGQVSYLDNDDIILTMTVTGTITVPSSRSLEAVTLPVEVTIDERYIEDATRLSDFEETEAVFLLENDVLNVDDAILDNIIANLPLQILTTEEKDSDILPSGKDWHVISEETYKNEKMSDNGVKLDPRLAKLDDFFKE
ncbi:DUF177 domain-containing protein [Leuconostoc falkenbergense]|uniref:DUF177 domain-containing protein n=1 Tax=Leuconostoc falkenbergense TaxID=2766470 RepID=UPI0019677765|nr:YceD family protein [Leuconostoc falkenbergense]QSB51565.1 DUF177 domain-containing protein [Leuconostoc falkenbergense]